MPSRAPVIVLVIVVVVMAMIIGVLAGKLWSQQGATEVVEEARSEPNAPPSTRRSALGSSSTTSTTATTEVMATTTPPVPTPPAPTGPTFRSPPEIAYDAVVVFFTFGVEAKGYPSFSEIISEQAVSGVLSQFMAPWYRNAGCYQIVESATPVPAMTSDYRHVFDVVLRAQCPNGPPVDELTGEPHPLTYGGLFEVVLGPAPSGGLWAVEVNGI